MPTTAFLSDAARHDAPVPPAATAAVINDRLVQLEAATRHLQDRICTLAARLEPILQPVPCGSQAPEKVRPDVVARSPLAEALSDRADFVAGMIDDINDLLARLEV